MPDGTTHAALHVTLACHLQTSGSETIRRVAADLPGLPAFVPETPDRGAPACAHLEEAFALCPSAGPMGRVANALKAMMPGLYWVVDYPDHPVLRTAFAHTVIAKSDTCLLGCNLIAPNTDYPAHAHSAEEIYIPLSDSGAPFWQLSLGQGAVKRPGDIILHGPGEPHALTTRARPLLNIWIQFGDTPGGPTGFVS